MAEWWTELWSRGRGSSRVYCGIARTEEGFAVDLFKGDRCLASETFANRPDAERAAARFERRYQRRMPPRQGGRSESAAVAAR